MQLTQTRSEQKTDSKNKQELSSRDCNLDHFKLFHELQAEDLHILIIFSVLVLENE